MGFVCVKHDRFVQSGTCTYCDGIAEERARAVPHAAAPDNYGYDVLYPDGLWRPSRTPRNQTVPSIQNLNNIYGRGIYSSIESMAARQTLSKDDLVEITKHTSASWAYVESPDNVIVFTHGEFKVDDTTWSLQRYSIPSARSEVAQFLLAFHRFAGYY